MTETCGICQATVPDEFIGIHQESHQLIGDTPKEGLNWESIIGFWLVCLVAGGTASALLVRASQVLSR